ncbi:MAG: MerR family transcriptional regulator [Clostridiales bacterium]|jgi:DNA-binding transcriptional MerR regulator|nr:MerR family transcriptional regulator [Clostridiales bacterium]
MLKLGIAEVAQAYGISARTLRYYEEAGILTSHRKGDSKYRCYDEAQIKRLEIILLLRRLSFDIKSIARLLNGDEGLFLAVLQERIADSGRRLLEAKETDSLLRNLHSMLLKKPAAALNAAEILGEFTYLTNQTRRVSQMNLPFSEEKFRVGIGTDFAQEVCGENAGNLLGKLKELRGELGEKLPPIRVRDVLDLGYSAVIVWNGVEVWRKAYEPSEVALCAAEIAARLKDLAQNNPQCQDR